MYKGTSKVGGQYGQKCQREHSFSATPVSKGNDGWVYKCRRCGHLEKVPND